MTNALAIRPLGWTPDGGERFDCQQDRLGWHLEIVTGFDEVPSVRGEDVIIPGRVGRLAGSRIGDLLSIELVGSVRGDLEDGSPMTEAERLESYRANVRELQAQFDPTLVGVVDVLGEDGTTYTIAARPLSLVYGSEDIPGERLISIALISTSSPYWTITPPVGP
jgi:hypothetical protein